MPGILFKGSLKESSIIKVPLRASFKGFYSFRGLLQGFRSHEAASTGSRKGSVRDLGFVFLDRGLGPYLGFSHRFQVF